MNKLQLYITKSFNGYKVLFNINPSEEITTHVRELRRVLEKVKYDATEKNIFYLTSTVSTGTFVTILRTIPSAPADHLAAWIYIPNELEISAGELENVLQTTTRKVSGDRVTQEDVTQLRELFGAEYPTMADAPAILASNRDGQLAWRGYNGDTGITLTHLLGDGLFQLPYLDYSGVLFVDADLGIEVEGADLTESPINPAAVIIPPEKSPENFRPYIYGKQLDCPYRATMDDNLTVVWKRPAFEDVITHQVITENPYIPEIPDTSASKKEISGASFQITTQTGSPDLENCQIMVNGIDVTHTPHGFTQAELSSASVVISCDGCAPYTGHLDLASSTRALVRMQERTKVYCFEMPVKSTEMGSPVKFRIFTKKTLTESPIEGYVALDNIQEGESRNNHLAFAKSNSSLMQKITFLGIGLLVGLAVSLGLTKCGGDTADNKPAPDVSDPTAVTDSTAATPETPVQPAAAAQTPQPGSTAVNNVSATADAIKYLDDNTTWTRDKLESYPALQGLFNDLNNFRMENLTGPWAQKLKESKRFGLIVQHANMGKNKKKRNLLPPYNKPGDYKIGVQGYLNRIDP